MNSGLRDLNKVMGIVLVVSPSRLGWLVSKLFQTLAVWVVLPSVKSSNGTYSLPFRLILVQLIPSMQAFPRWAYYQARPSSLSRPSKRSYLCLRDASRKYCSRGDVVCLASIWQCVQKIALSAFKYLQEAGRINFTLRPARRTSTQYPGSPAGMAFRLSDSAGEHPASRKLVHGFKALIKSWSPNHVLEGLQGL